MRNMFMKNQFDHPCAVCGQTVKAGTANLYATKGNDIRHERDRKPVWVTKHKKCKPNQTRESSANA